MAAEQAKLSLAYGFNDNAIKARSQKCELPLYYCAVLELIRLLSAVRTRTVVLSKLTKQKN